MTKSNQTTAGFTLIELLITLAILGVFSSVAVSQYSKYINRTNDSYGKMKIQEVLADQKTLFIQTRQYTTSFVKLGFNSDEVYSKQNLFKLSLDACDDLALTRCVQVTAVPVTGSQTTGTTFIANTNGEQLPLDRW